jgi:hypothetical protein
MKKLRLNVDELCVESFAAAPGSDGTGTVRAHAPPTNATCETFICPCQVTNDRSNCVCPVSQPC